MDVPRAPAHTPIRGEFLALPRESGKLAPSRALSVSCSICKACGSHYTKAAEWYNRTAVEAQRATDGLFDCSPGAGDWFRESWVSLFALTVRASGRFSGHRLLHQQNDSTPQSHVDHRMRMIGSRVQWTLYVGIVDHLILAGRCGK